MATWILAGDKSRARIFELGTGRDSPVEISDFANPGGRSLSRELRTDGLGRFYGRGAQTQGHSAMPNTTPAQHEVERFATALAGYLDQARTEHRYDKLWVVAPPEFLGVLRKSLPKEVHDCIEATVDKELTTRTPRDIVDAVERHREQARIR